MPSAELAFVAVVVALVAGAHALLAWRLFGRDSGLWRFRRAGRAGLALTAALILVAFPGNRYLPRDGELLNVQYMGFVALGVVLVLLPLVLLRDALLGARRLALVLRSAPGAVPVPDAALASRRAFLRGLSSLGAMGSASTLAAAGAVDARAPEVRRVRVPLAGLHPDLAGLRIAQLSDLHVGPIVGRAWLDEVVTATNALGCDLIAITGDLVDGHVPDLREDVAALRRLRAPRGVCFVTGNHEYYWDGVAWVDEVRRLGLDVLVNEHRALALGAATLVVAGVADFSARSSVPAHASDAARALSGAPRADLKLLLAHQPRSVYAARRLGVDLQLSGHTHGGQFFPWNLVMPFLQPLAKGLGRFGDTWLYVSRGTGTWGPPLRTGVPAEITEIELVRAEPESAR